MENLLLAAVGLLVLVLVVWLGRELVCWYWKINAGLEILERIDRNLAAIAEASRDSEDR